MKNTVKRHCIYKITSLKDGKIYIGQTNAPGHRWTSHKSEAKGENPPLLVNKAMKKHGIENFSFWHIIVMSSDLIKRANLYILKVALSRDIKPSELTFLSPEDQEYIATMGTSYDNPNHNNPPPFVASPRIWRKAKKAIKKYWGKYSSPYSILTHVYRQMHGKFKKKKKRKS